ALFTGFAARVVGGATGRAATLAVILGVPLVAAGITATQLGLGSWLECLAASWTASAGLLTAWMPLRLSAQPTWRGVVRGLWFVLALSLAGSMLLAGVYGWRFYLPIAWLDIPWMRALHGTANVFGFGLAGTLAWKMAGADLCAGLWLSPQARDWS